MLQLSLYFTCVLTTELTGRSELGKVNIRQYLHDYFLELKSVGKGLAQCSTPLPGMPTALMELIEFVVACVLALQPGCLL